MIEIDWDKINAAGEITLNTTEETAAPESNDAPAPELAQSTWEIIDMDAEKDDKATEVTGVKETTE